MPVGVVSSTPDPAFEISFSITADANASDGGSGGALASKQAATLKKHQIPSVSKDHLCRVGHMASGKVQDTPGRNKKTSWVLMRTMTCPHYL